MADDDEALKALKLKELLGRWSAQIHQQRREFEASADQVSTWDTSLREMVVDLHYLETGVDDLEQDCERIHRGLTEMEHVQKNFGLKLERLQADMERLVPTNPSTQSFGDPPSTYQGQAQLARAQAYGAALELGTLLDSLETVLDEVEQQVKAGQQETHPVRSAFECAHRAALSLLLFFCFAFYPNP
jgi:chromosome segregation ATPase